MENIEQLIRDISELYQERQERMLIDDIIGVYNGEIVDYSIYKEIKDKLYPNAEEIVKGNEDGSFSLNVKPLILTEKQFEYIKGKRARLERGK